MSLGGVIRITDIGVIAEAQGEMAADEAEAFAAVVRNFINGGQSGKVFVLQQGWTVRDERFRSQNMDIPEYRVSAELQRHFPDWLAVLGWSVAVFSVVMSLLS